MAETPQEVARRIGKEYVGKFPRLPPEDDRPPWNVWGGMTYPQVRRAFETMEFVNQQLFMDIPIPVVFTESDPYDDYEDMAESVTRDGELRIFSGGASHPIWDDEAERISRAVHDWHGHLNLRVPFTVVGEYLKWEHARTHYPAYCDRVLFTEVIGQLGAAIYLDEGYDDDRFEQKAFAAPAEWIEDMARAIERNK